MSDSPARDQRLVADGHARWWKSAEGLARRRQIEIEVRTRHGARLARAGWLKQLWIEHRIRREVAAECAKVTPPEVLWLED